MSQVVAFVPSGISIEFGKELGFAGSGEAWGIWIHNNWLPSESLCGYILRSSSILRSMVGQSNQLRLGVGSLPSGKIWWNCVDPLHCECTATQTLRMPFQDFFCRASGVHPRTTCVGPLFISRVALVHRHLVCRLCTPAPAAAAHLSHTWWLHRRCF